MPQDQVPIWKLQFQALGVVSVPVVWANNLADWIDQRVTSKLQLTGLFVGSSIFTWNKSVFIAQISALPPTPEPVSGNTAIAQAWMSSMQASVMVGFPGVVILPLISPPSVTINSGTLAAATAALTATLIGSAPVPISALAQFPDAFHTAFASVTYDIVGVGLGPTGPTPVASPSTPVI